MTTLFVGESGEIQRAVESQTRLKSSGKMLSCSFAEASNCYQVVRPSVQLLVIGVEQTRDGDMVTRLIESAAAKQIPVIVFAKSPTGNQVLDWLRLGSAAVELWPCKSSRLAFLVDSLLVTRRMNRPASAVKADTPIDDTIVLASKPMQRVIDQVNRVAPLDVNVLLGGETGVGKTRLAKQLHERSTRNDAPFFVVNCGALPENLLESELFGHKRGAFTGAETNRKGRFEEVGNGTLFLDEVDSIPIASQCKLLRAIENRVFEPLGSNKSIAFRGRIVAASNSQLEGLIAEGKFRADLFYRLGVVDLFIPPLRERREDILQIAEVALKTHAARNGLSVRSISPEVSEMLEAYSWPGNVRQLRNVIESSASLCRGEQIELTDLSERWLADARKSVKGTDSIPAPKHLKAAHEVSRLESQQYSLAESRAMLEANRIQSVLRDVGNNRTKAAIQLGISRTMLYKKIAKYGLAASNC